MRDDAHSRDMQVAPADRPYTISPALSLARKGATLNKPWMPLYVADYLADTAHLNAAQSGAYLHLIMHYWTTGALPDDDHALARIARMTGSEWKRTRPIIVPFFREGWRHKRIDSELAHAEQVSSKRRASAQQRHSNSSAIAEQMDTHARTRPSASPSPSQPQSDSSLRSERKTRASALCWPFEQFWAQYPHKVGKQDALKAFGKAEKSGLTTFEGLLLGLMRYAAKTDDRPWCNPATWLNEGRWDDQPAAPVASNGHGSPRPGSREDQRERSANAYQKLSDYVDAHADDQAGSRGADEEPLGLLPFAERP